MDLVTNADHKRYLQLSNDCLWLSFFFQARAKHKILMAFSPLVLKSQVNKIEALVYHAAPLLA
jgi:hypothetical protein